MAPRRYRLRHRWEGRAPTAWHFLARFGLGENFALLAAGGFRTVGGLSPWAGSRQSAVSRPWGGGGVSPVAESGPWGGLTGRRSLARGRGLAGGESRRWAGVSPGAVSPGAGSAGGGVSPGGSRRGRVSPGGVSPVAGSRPWEGSHQVGGVSPIGAGSRPARGLLPTGRRCFSGREASLHRGEASRRPAVAGCDRHPEASRRRGVALPRRVAFKRSFRRWLPSARGVSLGRRSPFRAVPARASVIGPGITVVAFRNLRDRTRYPPWSHPWSDSDFPWSDPELSWPDQELPWSDPDWPSNEWLPPANASPALTKESQSAMARAESQRSPRLVPAALGSERCIDSPFAGCVGGKEEPGRTHPAGPTDWTSETATSDVFPREPERKLPNCEQNTLDARLTRRLPVRPDDGEHRGPSRCSAPGRHPVARTIRRHGASSRLDSQPDRPVNGRLHRR